MKQIITALLQAQSEMSNPKKGSENPYFKSKYADLNAVREAIIPILNKHHIIVLQPTVVVEGKNYVKTLLFHESGESIESFTEIVFSKQNDAQAQGSGITYARRYGLQSLVCIGADDDDGNGASNPKKETINEAPTEMLTAEIKDLINKCKTAEDVSYIWNSNPNLKSNPEFKNLISTKGNEVKSK